MHTVNEQNDSDNRIHEDVGEAMTYIAYFSRQENRVSNAYWLVLASIIIINDFMYSYIIHDWFYVHQSLMYFIDLFIVIIM